MDDAILYFSGTGNTQLLAEELGKELNLQAHSIEEAIDWTTYLNEAERIIVLYPVYFSVPPMILREFIDRHRACFEHKDIICIASQMCYSGDGARVIEDFLPDSAHLIDTHHVNMPNNIPNIPFVPLASPRGNQRKTARALKQLRKIATNLQKGNFKRRHCSKLAIKLGEVQRVGGLKSEKSKKDAVRVSDACIRCGLCVHICPAQNFTLEKTKAVPHGNCTLCLRCENKCPVKAIRVLIDRPVKTQYLGPLSGD